MKNTLDWREYITVDPEICHGKASRFSQVGSRVTFFEACSVFTVRYGLHTRGGALRPSTP